MDNRQMSYFLAIIEEGSITKAANKLHLAQPYLSQQLKLLEDELEVKLVERTTRKFQVTEAGKMLAYRAKQILDLAEKAIKELKDFNEGIKGTLSIGCLSSATENLLTQKIYDFHKKYPDINFEIRQCSTDEILELLKRGVIEIGIVRSPLNLDIFESIPLPVEPMTAVSNNQIDLGKNDNYISLEELSTKPLLVHRRFEKDILSFFHKKGLKPRILCKIEDTRSILLLAGLGIGVGIVPKDWTNLTHSQNLRYKEIPELHLNTNIVITRLKNHYLTSVARHFLETF
ncbi:LysR family transcriptional regulator [Clostridium kluyveri]|uniref:LysR family transcriptional regulator n=1 Tax=Clostridium kluyveri TaxID=1534 RepID=A0A1L5FCY0_CLOKL|nr:LysR family transcriptional regulator [Clostridium kluyveri]APM40861.1 LysR family transcriptional regulator [Clostridium kluyveri]